MPKDLFAKLFGKKTDEKPAPVGLQPESISRMMDEDQFWAIVDQSRQSGKDQETELKIIMKSLSLEEIIGFSLRTDKLLRDAYTSELWCAGYLMNGGCSDDGFEYFRCWVIACGRDVYTKACANPDSLADLPGLDQDYYDFETFAYVAPNTFEDLTGQEMYDFVDEDSVEDQMGEIPDIEFNWNDDDPETMQAICPKLYDKFWAD